MMMTEADKALTSDWSGPIADAFFTDDSKATLKSEDEIKSSWSSLSTEQQAQVKQDCATVSSSTASAPGAGTSTDTTASTTRHDRHRHDWLRYLQHRDDGSLLDGQLYVSGSHKLVLNSGVVRPPRRS
jgi:hypothetical protein